MAPFKRPARPGAAGLRHKEAFMSIRSLFGKGRNQESVAEAAAADIECPHTTLVPRWDSVEDMGKEDAVSGYFCEGCRMSFSPSEAVGLMFGQRQRLEQGLVGGLKDSSAS
jgi:hypothetical protein